MSLPASRILCADVVSQLRALLLIFLILGVLGHLASLLKRLIESICVYIDEVVQ